MINNILMDESILAIKLGKIYLEAVKPEDNRKIILFGYDKESLESLGNHIEKYLNEKRENIEVLVENEPSQDAYMIDVGWVLEQQAKSP